MLNNKNNKHCSENLPPLQRYSIIISIIESFNLSCVYMRMVYKFHSNFYDDPFFFIRRFTQAMNGSVLLFHIDPFSRLRRLI